ncbi:hypothetical protein [Peribacillus sp. Hz7]|uniref:hypothetical protein n=1 Tax=Peribacillus sp. Hz7 TaxID=3344873 RepID=UPI0035C9A9A5
MRLDTWLKEYKKGTFDKHEMNIRTRILPYFQDILLKDVKPVLYQKFINHLGERFSRETIKIVHSTMHNAFEKDRMDKYEEYMKNILK